MNLPVQIGPYGYDVARLPRDLGRETLSHVGTGAASGPVVLDQAALEGLPPELRNNVSKWIQDDSPISRLAIDSQRGILQWLDPHDWNTVRLINPTLESFSK